MPDLSRLAARLDTKLLRILSENKKLLLDSLMGPMQTHTIVGALVHVDTLKTNRCRVQVEVDTPEGRAKRIAQARSALVIQRVGFSENKIRDSFAWVLGDDTVVFDNVTVDRLLRFRMVH